MEEEVLCMFEQAKWIGCHTDMGEVCPEFMRTVEITGGMKSDE